MPEAKVRGALPGTETLELKDQTTPGTACFKDMMCLSCPSSRKGTSDAKRDLSFFDLSAQPIEHVVLARDYPH
jgi:hypothetical protein